MKTPAAQAFGVTRFGLSHNPRGAQVVYQNKPYDVLGFEHRELPSTFGLRLRTFDRSQTLWAPISACYVLNRDTP